MKCNQPGSMSIVLTLKSSPLIGPLTTNHRLTVIFEHDQALTFVIVRKNSLYFHPLPYRLFLHTIRAILSAKNGYKTGNSFFEPAACCSSRATAPPSRGHVTLTSADRW